MLWRAAQIREEERKKKEAQKKEEELKKTGTKTGVKRKTTDSLKGFPDWVKEKVRERNELPKLVMNPSKHRLMAEKEEPQRKKVKVSLLNEGDEAVKSEQQKKEDQPLQQQLEESQIEQQQHQYSEEDHHDLLQRWQQRRTESPPILNIVSAKKTSKATATVTKPQQDVVIKVDPDTVISISSGEEEAVNLSIRGQHKAQVSVARSADPVVGGAATHTSCKPEECSRPRREGRIQTTTTLSQEFEKNMRERPWPGDDDVLDTSLVAAPKASLTKPRSSGPGKESRPCWLRLHRGWLRHNLNHFIGDSNIRYRGVTYASLCHHPTTHWDCHCLCWQCWKEFDLPMCGVQPEIECKFCEVMGPVATALRTDRLLNCEAKRNYAAKTGLPKDVYTQEDADEYIAARDLWERPNPDWLVEGHEVGDCFPRSLVKPGESVAQAVARNPDWKKPNYGKLCNVHNTSKRAQNLDVTTPSSDNQRYVPLCLTWGATRVLEPSIGLQATSQTITKLTGEIEKGSLASFIDSSTKAIQALQAQVISISAGKPETMTSEDWKVIVEAAGKPPGILQQPESTAQVPNLEEPPKTNEKEKLDELITPDRPVKTKLAESPLQKRQNIPPPIAEKYEEKGLSIEEWEKGHQVPLYGGTLQDAPDTTLSGALESLHEYGVEVPWMTEKGKDQLGNDHTIFTPAIDPAFLAQHWKVVESLKTKKVFDIRFEFPTSLGKCFGLQPHYNLVATETRPDANKKFPTSKDTNVMTLAENEQFIRLSAGVAVMNNIVFTATKLLSLRVEDFARSFEGQRAQERALCNVIKEASITLNEANTKLHVLSVAIMRRDAMVRRGMDPEENMEVFSSPVTDAGPYNPCFGTNINPVEFLFNYQINYTLCSYHVWLTNLFQNRTSIHSGWTIGPILQEESRRRKRKGGQKCCDCAKMP